jgi:hypothetical protein
MIDFQEVYIRSEQPTTCPKCFYRTEIVLDLSHTKDETQIHRCLNSKCQEEFVEQYDESFDNQILGETGSETLD